MFLKRSKRLESAPSSIKGELENVFSLQIKIIVIVIFFSIVLSKAFSNKLDNLIPFGRFLWIFFILVFFVCIIKVTSKIDKTLKKKNTNIAAEYNKFGDSLLFDYATKKGTLELFDLKKIISMCLMVSFFLSFFTFGILALHLALFKGLKEFLLFGIIPIIVTTGMSFLFWFEDKRILNEAVRRNKFIDIAKKRWKISKIIYITIVILSLILSFVLIKNNMNFLEKGVITSNGQKIYDGRQ